MYKIKIHLNILKISLFFLWLYEVFNFSTSSVQILTNKWKSTSRCFLQNGLYFSWLFAHLSDVKLGLEIPCSCRATARPVQLISLNISTKSRTSDLTEFSWNGTSAAGKNSGICLSFSSKYSLTKSFSLSDLTCSQSEQKDF